MQIYLADAADAEEVRQRVEPAEDVYQDSVIQIRQAVLL